MTEYQIANLMAMKERIIKKVERGELPIKEGAEFLGISRQGLLKLRKSYRRYGEKAILGLKRGPKRWHRPWNRTDEKLEDRVKAYRVAHPWEGPITIAWNLEEEGILLHHQTI